MPVAAKKRKTASSPPRPSAAPAEPFHQRLRQLRREQGWSLDFLADASGVSRSMLSQIERGKANPTLAVTFRIAHAFGLTLSDLVEEPGAGSMIEVIRADDRSYHYRTDPDCRIRTLSPLNLEKDVEFYEIRLKSGGALRSSAHYRGTREYVTVLQGRLAVECATDRDELGPGDSASYAADRPHALVNLGKNEARLGLVVIYR